MTIARAKEILAKINAKELDGADFPSADDEHRSAYAEDIGITVDEFDEFVSLHLAGDLDPILHTAADKIPIGEFDDDDFESAMPAFDTEAWENENGISCRESDKPFNQFSTDNWQSDAMQIAAEKGGDDDDDDGDKRW